MRVKLCLVSEVNPRFMNQVKLCLFSLRRNGGALRDVPVILITNDVPPKPQDRAFLEANFGPIEFQTRARFPHPPKQSAKLAALDTQQHANYDVLLFMDCDTVVLGDLAGMLDPVVSGVCDFLCRRGGASDRATFLDIDQAVAFVGAENSDVWADWEGRLERPMFNTGVFAVRSEVAQRIGTAAKEILPKIFTQTFLKHDQPWGAEQCALALACIREGVNVRYMSEIYNSWGDVSDIRILHCFKSRYRFDRVTMFKTFDQWRHKHTEVPGELGLVRTVEQYVAAFPH